MAALTEGLAPLSGVFVGAPATSNAGALVDVVLVAAGVVFEPQAASSRVAIKNNGNNFKFFADIWISL